MKCEPIITGDQWTCQRCGYSGRTKQSAPARIHRQCHGPQGWGDWLAGKFAKHLRVRKCSGCGKRQRRCNGWLCGLWRWLKGG